MYRKDLHYAIFFIQLLCFPFTFRYFYQHNVLEHPVSLNLTVTIYRTKEIQAEENIIKFPTGSNGNCKV